MLERKFGGKPSPYAYCLVDDISGDRHILWWDDEQNAFRKEDGTLFKYYVLKWVEIEELRQV